ncbi:hypothetical protein HK099_000548 [Clydaea vesicula]|uniref:Uncharacterized protein n=1 Tax=Clydaea vesicula TaxID=447962 RepID=A0AAD5TUY9_9FUNG|nr:hypothetical protein HK099_000548 [Clydaea vesicula]
MQEIFNEEYRISQVLLKKERELFLLNQLENDNQVDENETSLEKKLRLNNLSVTLPRTGQKTSNNESFVLNRAHTTNEDVSSNVVYETRANAINFLSKSRAKLNDDDKTIQRAHTTSETRANAIDFISSRVKNNPSSAPESSVENIEPILNDNENSEFLQSKENTSAAFIRTKLELLESTNVANNQILKLNNSKQAFIPRRSTSANKTDPRVQAFYNKVSLKDEKSPVSVKTPIIFDEHQSINAIGNYANSGSEVLNEEVKPKPIRPPKPLPTIPIDLEKSIQISVINSSQQQNINDNIFPIRSTSRGLLEN